MAYSSLLLVLITFLPDSSPGHKFPFVDCFCALLLLVLHISGLTRSLQCSHGSPVMTVLLPTSTNKSFTMSHVALRKRPSSGVAALGCGKWGSPQTSFPSGGDPAMIGSKAGIQGGRESQAGRLLDPNNLHFQLFPSLSYFLVLLVFREVKLL